MRYVVGMVGSSPNSTGGKRRGVELDFVRLVLAVRTLHVGGSTAHGYLLAPDERVAARARSWQRKYAATDLVTIFRHDSSVEMEGCPREETRPDAPEMTWKALSLSLASSAPPGEMDAREALCRAIRGNEPGVTEASSATPAPFGVRWDYFGTRGVSAERDQA